MPQWAQIFLGVLSNKRSNREFQEEHRETLTDILIDAKLQLMKEYNVSHEEIAKFNVGTISSVIGEESSGGILNDSGQVLFWATLTDGRGVLLLATPARPVKSLLRYGAKCTGPAGLADAEAASICLDECAERG